MLLPGFVGDESLTKLRTAAAEFVELGRDIAVSNELLDVELLESYIDHRCCQTAPMSRRTWIVVLTGAAMVFLTMGTRQSIGLFLKPVTDDLGADRESFAEARRDDRPAE